MRRRSEIPLVWPGAAEALRASVGSGEVGTAAEVADGSRGLSERMIEKLQQLARFGLAAGQSVFRSGRSRT